MTAHRVDLDELAEVLSALGADLASLSALAADLDREARHLDGAWSGLAFDSYAAARASFDAGFASMRSALAGMESAGTAACDRYAAAVDHNVALWRGLA